MCRRFSRVGAYYLCLARVSIAGLFGTMGLYYSLILFGLAVTGSDE